MCVRRLHRRGRRCRFASRSRIVPPCATGHEELEQIGVDHPTGTQGAHDGERLVGAVRGLVRTIVCSQRLEDVRDRDDARRLERGVTCEPAKRAVPEALEEARVSTMN